MNKGGGCGVSRTCYEDFLASNISADRRRHMHGDARHGHATKTSWRRPSLMQTAARRRNRLRLRALSFLEPNANGRSETQSAASSGVVFFRAPGAHETPCYEDFLASTKPNANGRSETQSAASSGVVFFRAPGAHETLQNTIQNGFNEPKPS